MRARGKFSRILGMAVLAFTVGAASAQAQLPEQPWLLRMLWPFGQQDLRPVAQLPPRPKVERGFGLVAPPAPRPLIDINNCTLEQLQNLPGVGAATGARLMAGRPFRDFDDLTRDGIPLNVVEGLRGVITFGR